MAHAISNVLVKRGNKWYVYSHDRKKKLGGPYDTKAKATARLRQVEYFKKKGAKNMAKSKRQFRHAFFKAQVKGIRNEKLNNRDHLVVPMVMLTEGVHSGSEGPYLYDKEELSKRPEVWNMKPVVVYHPDGPTACTPEVINNRGVGVIMNTRWDGRLVAEAWLEKDKLEQVDSRVAEAIANETMLELSTGLFADSDEESGTFDGGDCEEDYQGRLYNFGPDHLAILPDQVGACSMEDGAGFYRNARGDQVRLSRQWMQYFNALSANEKREQLEALLYVEGKYTYVVDITDNSVIYERDEKFYEREYEADGDVLKLVGVPWSVVRKISYIPVSNAKEIESMNKEQKQLINELISNEATQWGEDDREWLAGHELDVLRRFTPIKNEDPEDKETNEPVTTSKKKDEVTPVANTDQPKPVTVEEALTSLPEEIQNTLRESLARDNEEKGGLIDAITKNERCAFTKEELQDRSLKELRNLAALATPPEQVQGQPTIINYSGQGEPVSNSGDDVPALQRPKLNFAKA
jgi:uncharacterized protein YifN (PemK superfamily)